MSRVAESAFTRPYQKTGNNGAEVGYSRPARAAGVEMAQAPSLGPCFETPACANAAAGSSA